MKAVKTLAIGGGALIALAGASAPAAAQIYPGYPGYGSPYGYGYGYNRGNEQFLVQQCTNAVQQRLSGYGYGGYSPYGYGYGNGSGRARVLGVTRIDRRTPGILRIRGEAASGMNYGNGGYGNAYGYGGYGGYGGGYGAPADLTFRCDIDFRGYIRDIDVNRRRYY
jgi:hypothetical protein